jgi:integrase
MSVISKVLGHSSISITSDTYSHLLAKVGKAASEAAAAATAVTRR